MIGSPGAMEPGRAEGGLGLGSEMRRSLEEEPGSRLTHPIGTRSHVWSFSERCSGLDVIWDAGGDKLCLGSSAVGLIEAADKPSDCVGSPHRSLMSNVLRGRPPSQEPLIVHPSSVRQPTSSHAVPYVPRSISARSLNSSTATCDF